MHSTRNALHSGGRRIKQGILWLLRRLPGSHRLTGIPRCHALATHEWFSDKGSKASRLGASFRQIHAEEVVQRAPPRQIGSHIHWKFKGLFSEVQPRSFVAVIPYARVWGNCGAVITPDGRLLGDVSREFGRHQGGNSAFEQLRLHRATFVSGTTAVVGTAGSDVYYHWMFDVLPRFAILQQAVPLHSIDHFILNHTGQRFQVESLETLGVPTEKFLMSRDHWGFHIEAESLAVPSLPSRLDSVSRQSCAFLRDLFKHHFTQDKTACRRIYISRAKASARRVLNEDEVIAALKPLNFEVVQLEGMSIGDQVALFSTVSCVVGPHGAGHTNLVFSPPGAKLVDIFAPAWINPCYWTLCEAMRHEYYYLVGKGDTPDEYCDPEGKGDDIIVSIEELNRTLSMAALH